MDTKQRFSAANPCPVCNGHRGLPQREGRRCFGFLSSDGSFANCTREEHAGRLRINESSKTFAHFLKGECRCGQPHGVGLAQAPPAHRDQNNPTAVLDSALSDVSQVAPVRPLSSHEGRATQDIEAYRDRNMGKPSHLWPYFNAEGTLVGYAARWDLPSGKQIRPLTLSGNGRWQQKGIPTPRPLYNLSELNYRPEDPVLVVEGEKTSDAAGDLLPSLIPVTSAGGAMSPHFTDWTPLKGRDVTIWHDNDSDGFAYAENVAKLAHEHGAISVKVVTLPEALPANWDLADPIPENVDMDIARLVAEAKPIASGDKEPEVDEETDNQSRRQSAGDQLFQWAKEAIYLYAMAMAMPRTLMSVWREDFVVGDIVYTV